jgi:L-ascorbate metabolism protein UlaG (beta-lactamase superfamily)
MVSGILMPARFIENFNMKIVWRGHSSFIIDDNNKRIITDPMNAKYGYPQIPLTADIVTVSHEHLDHNAVETVGGNPLVIRGTGLWDVDGVIIKGIASHHDHRQGQERGHNTIFKISLAGIDLLHLGDLGELLSSEQLLEIGKVDIVFLPVGGRYTIDAAQACKVISLLRPKIVIPMHYQTAHLSFSLAPVEEFTTHYDHVIKKGHLEVQPSDLEGDTKIIVLDYLLG